MFCPLRLFYVFILLSIPVSSQLDAPIFAGFQDVGSNLSLNGVAEIEKNGILRLTNKTSRLMGQAFYASPFQFKNSSRGKALSFSASFAFAIVPEYPKLGGHGLAFTIATSKELKGLPSQYLGLLNASDVGNSTNHLLAIEFDTVQDFEFGDINDNHVGIDINSLNSNMSAAAAYYIGDTTKVDLNLKSGNPIQAWVEYDSVHEVLNVSISPTSSKPKLPILSFPVDLSPIIEEFMYVGFSASTGLLASSHYLLGWSFKINGQAPALDLSTLPSLPGHRKRHQGLKIGLLVVLGFLVVSVAAIATIYILKKIRDADTIEDWELEIGPHRYSYQELKQATSGFSEKELLGHGGFGQVYRGTLPDSKTQVAVKRISHESKQGLKEFVSEIASIGRLRHRNLVQLLGWCRRRENLLIVYDFMANGSLDRFLFDEPKTVLNWNQRINIIKDVASGLLYLHEGYEKVVIHRDVKASNVLLDSDLTGKLGDFGLARLHEHGSQPGTTRIVGTLGYLAPEFTRTGKATAGSDMFAFGALLLEVVSGRRPIDPKAAPDELVLVDWVWDRFKEGRVHDIVDRRLNLEYNTSEVALVIKLGLMCSNPEPKRRPSMKQVVRYLEGEADVPENLRVQDERKGGGVEEGFDDFVNSFASTSFDKVSSSYSFMATGDVGISFGSISTSQISLVQPRD